MMHLRKHMRLPLTLAAALATFVVYVNSLQAQTSSSVSAAHLDGFAGATITHTSENEEELCFTFRAARGSGAMSSEICVHGELSPASQAELLVVEEWQPHLGARETRRAEEVDAYVRALDDGSMRVFFTASFENSTSTGSFVVPRRQAK